MKTKRFDLNFKPLRIHINLSVEGSIPDKQNFNADTGEYTPDYTITPLIIQPFLGLIDKDMIIQAGRINASLTNVRWYETINGDRKVIDSENTNFEITTSGDQAGRIKVKKNASYRVPISLEFYAEYIDPRTNQVFAIRQPYSVRCDNSTAAIPVLNINAADQTIYNPLKDQDIQTITASLRSGAEEVPASKRIFVWEVFREDNTWTPAGEDLDYMLTVENENCTIDRSLMGSELQLRCRAKYDIGGNPSSVELNESSPNKIVSFIRRIPGFEYDIVGVPANIPAGMLIISPEAVITDTNGIITNPEKALLPLWYIATNKVGTLNYQLVDHGMNSIISTTPFDSIQGAVVGLDVVDIGPAGVWEDSDGALFEDEQGNLILI